MKSKAIFLAAAIILTSTNVWAARLPIHEAAESDQYGRKAGGMFGRGLLNVTTCFMDLLVNVVNETKSGPPLVGTLVGVGKGAGCTTLRALSGATDVLTFWVPGFNGFPVSDSYENCIESSGAPLASDQANAQDNFSAPTYVPTDEPGAAQMPTAYPSENKTEQEPVKPRYTK
jgi:putative exosortase-associated protein (TIGR04073 family)